MYNNGIKAIITLSTSYLMAYLYSGFNSDQNEYHFVIPSFQDKKV